MEAKVTTAFPGRPDNDVMTRTIEVGEIISGELAVVAVREKWAKEIKPAAETSPDDGLGKLKVEDLKALAEAEKIDLGEASRKDDILAAIRAARAAG